MISHLYTKSYENYQKDIGIDISEFSKFVRYKINIKKKQFYFYIKATNCEIKILNIPCAETSKTTKAIARWFS